MQSRHIPSRPPVTSPVHATMRIMSEHSIQSTEAESGLNRRRFLAACSAAGLANTLLPGALLALIAQRAAAQSADSAKSAPPPKITPEMIDAAAAIAGITLTGEQKTMMLGSLNAQRDSAAAIRKLHLPNSVAPATIFHPVPPGMVLDTVKRPIRISPPPHVVVEKDGVPREAAPSRSLPSANLPSFSGRGASRPST